MILFPNAKINLGLFITEKRPDGFHNIETILFPIPLCDALECVETYGQVETQCIASLYIHGIKIDGNPTENLVYKAYELLKNDFNLPNIRIDLLKKIPFGAGLGGGSADAAFMLKLLNQKFMLKISDEKLENYARKIGSDCAFFIKNKPVFAYEKGDKFEPINLDLSGYQLVLICPPIHVSTKTAYQNVVARNGSAFREPQRPNHTSVAEALEATGRFDPLARICNPCQEHFDLRKLSEIPMNEWKTVLQNDFEPSVFAQYPILSDIKQNLYDLGAEYASMSGSGSAIFGLFSKEQRVEKNKRLTNHFDYQSFIL